MTLKGSPAPGPTRSGATPSGDTGRFTVLTLTVALTALTRLFLAGRDSYWLDELYSVYAYTVQPDGLLDAIRALAETSIHPPLYQGILYGWVAVFGDGEIATRTLSSIYVALAVIVLHRLVARQFDDRMADCVAVVFAVGHTATTYGLETRSYAQTVLLTVLSMYALERCLRGSRQVPGRWWPVSAAVWFSLANLGLLLTHYYNAFFVAAQAVMVVAYVLVRTPGGAVVRDALRVVATYLVQLGVFLLLWGRQMVASYRDDSGHYDIDTVVHSPLDMAAQVLEQNITLGRLTPLALVLACLGALVVAVRSLVAARGLEPEWPDDPTSPPDDRTDGRMFGLLQAGWMAIGPTAVAYLGFMVVQAERYMERYFLYLVPAFSILFTWVALGAVDAVRARLPRARRHPPGDASTGRPPTDSRRLHVRPAALPLLLAAVLAVPGGYAAATEGKADWRGSAERIAAIVTSQPDASFAIYETSFRVDPMLDYYLARHGDDLRADGTIRRFEQTRDAPYAFEENLDEIRAHDYLVVPFVHHTVDDMAPAVEALDRTFTRHLVQIDPDGRGLMVFDTDPPS